MLFLVELDHTSPAASMTPDAGRAFIENIILPTLAQAEKLLAEKRVVSGGPVVGQIALRFMVEAASPAEVDQIISSLPLWPLATTRVTPLVSSGERRQHVQALLNRIASGRP
jgi:muconolactone delta-isomerase